MINTTQFRYAVFALVGFLLMVISSCAGKGLVTEKYKEGFYKVPKLLPEKIVTKNQTFIVYSDNQTGWRAYEKFVRKENWTSRKMFIFPFYQLYLVGNGLVGALNWFRHVPDYGGEQRRMVRDAVYAEAKYSNAAFIISIGDMVAHDGRRPFHWEIFLNENRFECPLLDEIPYLPVIGNHENASDVTFGYPNFTAVFDYPRFYVLELPDVALIVLDSNYILDQKQYIPNERQDELFEEWFVSTDNKKEASWLEQQFDALKKPFKIVAMHHPPISCAKHREDWFDTSYGNDLEGKRRRLLELFIEENVQVVLSGHDHLYQHSTLKTESGKQIHFLVGGGGGTPLRSAESKKDLEKCHRSFIDMGLNVTVHKHDRFYHYMLVSVDHDILTIEIIEVTGNSKEPTRRVDEIAIYAD